MTNDTPPNDTPRGEPRKPAARRLAGIDDAALAGSGRASRLIGSKVYKGDTSIGKIEDVLVDIDHARLADSRIASMR